MKPLRTVSLCGGVGGAKLAFGLAHELGQNLTVIANTGDDFEHLDLKISPDIDTILYTLSGLASRERGWGREDESWNFMDALGQINGPQWFQLGDRDLALHVLRSHALHQGQTLSSFVKRIASIFGIACAIVPMTDASVRTMLESSEGLLSFQEYFVARQCAPLVDRIFFSGAEEASPSPQAVAALTDPELDVIILCPSNPFLSIDPILAVPGIRDLINQASAPVIAVSPLIGGKAVKGPTAKLMHELGHEVSSTAVLRHYGSMVDGWVIDVGDAEDSSSLGLPVLAVPTLMQTDVDRVRLATDVLRFANSLNSRSASDAI